MAAAYAADEAEKRKRKAFLLANPNSSIVNMDRDVSMNEMDYSGDDDELGTEGEI